MRTIVSATTVAVDWVLHKEGRKIDPSIEQQDSSTAGRLNKKVLSVTEAEAKIGGGSGSRKGISLLMRACGLRRRRRRQQL